MLVPRTFPEGFRWGVATSGHQIEGGNTRSDTWFLEHVRPTVFRAPSGQACNSYELWRKDVDLVAGLGLDTYRFSVEWARVEPAEGEFSGDRARQRGRRALSTATGHRWAATQAFLADPEGNLVELLHRPLRPGAAAR